MKYYFIAFMYGASEKTPVNMLIMGHPLEWLRMVNRSQGYKGQYVLLNWKEISEEEYLEHITINENC